MSKAHPRRLSAADATFIHVGEATGQPPAPVGFSIYEGPFDPGKAEHLQAIQRRMSSRGRQRIVRDRCSFALPRWVDVPDFDPTTLAIEMDPPGDGTLRAVLDFAEEWALRPFPEGFPPWRSVMFHGVLVDGVPRTVSLGQSHHAMSDGEGGRLRGLQLVQFSPDDPMPDIPDVPEEPIEHISALARWAEGWGLEAKALGGVLGRGAKRAARAARRPAATARRARSLVRDGRALKADLGHTPSSPLLTRKSNRLQLDVFEVDLVSLKAGAKAAGGTLNDGMLAAVALGLRWWHADHGVSVDTVRTSMAVNLRAKGDATLGNNMIAVIVPLPLDSDDPTDLVRRCGEASRKHRTEGEGMRLMEVGRAVGTRLPKGVMVRAARKNMSGIDVQLSNAPGLPYPYWVAGSQALGGGAFPVGTASGLAVIMSSHGATASFGMITDPAVVTDRDVLIAHLQAGFAAVDALAVGLG